VLRQGSGDGDRVGDRILLLGAGATIRPVGHLSTLPGAASGSAFAHPASDPRVGEVSGAWTAPVKGKRGRPGRATSARRRRDHLEPRPTAHECAEILISNAP
jgi:hypothetical protein